MTATAMPGYVPYLIAATVGFSIYRRIRSHFGRQPWRPKRTIARVVILSLFLVPLALLAVVRPTENWGIGVGAALGIGLGLLALRLMRFDTTGGQPGYTPNPWIGAALTGLLVGRMAWRFVSGGFTTPQTSSPLTLAIAATVLTFYVVQGLGLMQRMKRMTAAPGAVVTP
ncbi:hypothetical protein DWG18_03650 [Lysobacter sp. TY2-98]|uniref:hypothetical protein n=1 Tax=Lysobacter sp. TY2-98 TaxID=2290922 RepID=UPI000E20AE51|nr:hypothetical protein [Lysobacter sp. TY2-98]AXK71475.1 hypothetical protein DWG18_03650 [Lysobacter sp. TY2-98]